MTLTFIQRKGLTSRNTNVKYENSITYHSKGMGNVTVFFGQTDKETGQKLYACDLSMKGHKLSRKRGLNAYLKCIISSKSSLNSSPNAKV